MTLTLYRTAILAAANAHRLDANLIEAVVICESAGRADAFRFEPGFYERYLAKKPEYRGQNPRRISSSYGLMQVMWTTALEHDFPYPEPEYLFIPEINLEYGCRVLGDRLEWANGDVLKALAAYNGGKGNWLGTDAQAYAKKVNGVLEQVQEARR